MGLRFDSDSNDIFVKNLKESIFDNYGHVVFHFKANWMYFLNINVSWFSNVTWVWTTPLTWLTINSTNGHSKLSRFLWHYGSDPDPSGRDGPWYSQHNTLWKCQIRSDLVEGIIFLEILYYFWMNVCVNLAIADYYLPYYPAYNQPSHISTCAYIRVLSTCAHIPSISINQ